MSAMPEGSIWQSKNRSFGFIFMVVFDLKPRLVRDGHRRVPSLRLFWLCLQPVKRAGVAAFGYKNDFGPKKRRIRPRPAFDRR